MSIEQRTQTLRQFHLLLSSAVFASAIAGQSARADCECPPNSVEQAILDADRIFRAEVVSAEIAEDSQTIEFVVEVGDTIRGSPEKHYRLITALPDSCGVPVRLGFHDMYVLGPNETRVSSCTGSGRAAFWKYPLLGTAIALVDLPVADSRGAQRLLSEQFHSGYDRATVDEFFELVERIDPTGHTATGTGDRIEYRGTAVHFNDGKVKSVELL